MARRWPAVLVCLLLVLAVGVLATDPMPLRATHTASVGRQRPTLAFGSRGAAVRTAQTLLTRHGYPVPATGYFGPITRNQVRRFQAAKGIRTTGNVGPLTWAALERTSRPPTVGGPTVTPVGGARSPLLAYGSRGPAVRTAQTLLCRHRFTVPVTGIFGTITQRQVRRFQAARGLATTGKIGLGTWAALRRSPPRPPPVLGPGSRGAAVRTLQRRLRVHGYTLPVTGVYGDGTTSAVVRFQLEHGIPTTGRVGQRTWVALRRAPTRCPPQRRPTPRTTAPPTTTLVAMRMCP
jgi:peptidoglycan DL-endopeptidase CwlO